MEKVSLEEVSERGSSNLAQKDIDGLSGDYPIYGAAGYIGNVNFYHQNQDYIAVVKDGAGIGRTMYLPAKSSVIGTLQYILPKDNILPKYLYYAVKNMRLAKYYTGATIPHIYYKDYKKEKFWLPDKKEQEKVVTVLERVEGIIGKRQRELLELDVVIKSRFVEMFGNVQREERFHGIPLRELCTTINGGTPSTMYPEYYEGDIPWISTVSLGPNHIDGTTAKGFITKEAISNSATKLIPAGNILFGTRVGVGKSSLNDVDICTNQDIVAIVGIDEKKYSRLFIKHVLDSYQPYFDSIKKGATILGITSEDLKDSLIPQVPMSLQNKYEIFVEQIDKLKVVIQHTIQKNRGYLDVKF